MTENPNSMNTTKIASEFNYRKITDTKHADRLLDVDIIVRDNRWAENDGLEERLVDGIRKARSLGGKEFSGPEDIACVLTNDEEVRTLNSKFFAVSTPFAAKSTSLLIFCVSIRCLPDRFKIVPYSAAVGAAES